MRTKRILITFILILLVGLLVFQIPAVKERTLWGYIQAEAYLRGVINPAGQIPTPLPNTLSELTSQPTSTLAPTHRRSLTQCRDFESAAVPVGTGNLPVRFTRRGEAAECFRARARADPSGGRAGRFPARHGHYRDRGRGRW